MRDPLVRTWKDEDEDEEMHFDAEVEVIRTARQEVRSTL